MSADEAAALASDGLPVDPAPPHTEMKLAVLSRYIGYVDERGRGGGFLHATRSAVYRRYIDGFAGVGRYDFGSGHVRDGSALIALRAEVPGAAEASSIRFTQLRFVELDQSRAEILEARTRATVGAEARARVLRGDANVVIVDVLKEVEDRTPTLVLLDPYDLDDLRFETVRLIATWHEGARARRIEQLIGLQIGRIRRQADLERGQMPSKESLDQLERLLGNRRWEPVMQEWVARRREWSEVFAAMRDSFEEELRRIGYVYTRHCDVDERDPMYSLVFASDHKDADTIMAGSIDHWRRDPKLRQRGLF